MAMTMKQVLDVLNNRPEGFMVSFEWWGDGGLTSDYFPDRKAGDLLIPTEHEAWELARTFARATKGSTCNLRVVNDQHIPVKDYEKREIKNR